MNTPRSAADINSSTAFKALQFQFINWAARWANSGDQIEPHSIDLPELVQLLQALGFYIRRMDGCLPKETTPLRDNQRGIRVIVTCNYSGHRCYLEQPLKEEMCKCMKILKDDSKDTYWEIVATQPNQETSVVETGSDLIPPVSKELKQIIYSVTSYLIKMVQGNGKEKDELTAAEKPAATEVAPKRYSDQFYSIKRPVECSPVKAAFSMHDITKKPPIIVSSSYKGTDSPTRYRSLDTLTSKDADSGFPEPGKLNAMYSISESETSALSASNNQLTVDDDIDADSKSTIGESRDSGKALSLMKRALKDLVNAISLIETNNADISTESVFEKDLKRNLKSSKSGVSSPSKSPLAARSVSSPSLSKPSSLTARTLQGKSPKLSTKSSSSSSIKTGAKGKKIENKSELKRSGSASGVGENKTKVPGKLDIPGQALKRTTNLYAHIKSTIPKPISLKKK